MDSNIRFVRPGRAGMSALAGLFTALALSHCQRAEDPVSSRPAAASPQAAGPVPRGLAEEGRKATDEEVAFLMAAKNAPAAEELMEAGARTALGKTAALPACMVDFNQSYGLGLIPDQCFSTFAVSPYYYHLCNNNGYWVAAQPLNLDHYHLMSEHPQHCKGTKPKWGIKSGNQCINQTDAKYWPRIASNMGGNTGVRFWAKNTANVRKNFDLKSITVVGGTMVLYAYRVGIGWWQWPNIPPGYWTFPWNSTNISEVQVFNTNHNGTITYDNLEIAIIP